MTGMSDIYAWQYTSSGQVPGINDGVDLSIIYGDVKSPVITNPSPTISEVLITILGKINTKSGIYGLQKDGPVYIPKSYPADTITSL